MQTQTALWHNELRRRTVLRAAAAAGALTLASGTSGPASLASAATSASTSASTSAQRPSSIGRPMYQQDAQHSGRSPHVGPRKPRILRTFDTTNPGINAPAAASADIQSSAVGGPDGTIYLSTFQGNLWALRDSRTADKLEAAWWFHPENTTSFHATPAVTSDNIVYMAFSTRTDPVATLYALRAPRSGLEADVVWSLNLGPGRTTYSPTIGPDGTIYTVNGANKVLAITADGGVRWSAQIGPVTRAAASLAPDGTVYLPATDGKLYAVRPPAAGSNEGSVKWTFDFGENMGAQSFPTGQAPSGGNGIGSGCGAAIGPDGTLYVGANNSNFYAINPDGTLKWLFEAEREIAGIWSDPALSADGKTVYFGANAGGVYALNTADGKLRWQSKIFGTIYSPMTLDSTGTLFTGSTVGHLFVIDSTNGQWHADVDTQGYPGIWTAPIVRPNGTVFAATRRGQALLFGP